MRPLFTLILILNLLNVNSQDLDSLLKLAAQLPSDTEKVNLFYKTGFSYRSIDPQFSYDCAKRAEEHAKKSESSFYIAKAYNLLGVLYYRKNDLSKALFYHKKALRLRSDINDKRGIAISHINLGNIFSDLKRYKLAEDAYIKALQINNELNDQKQIGNCFLNLGVLNAGIASALKDSVSAIAAKVYFNKAIDNARARHDYELEALCYNNLAVVNTVLKNFDEAIGNSYNSIKLKEMMDNHVELADSYLNIANAFLLQGNTAFCDLALRRADSIIEVYDYTTAKVQSEMIRSEYFKQTGQFEPAFEHLKKHYRLKDSLDKLYELVRLENGFVEELMFEDGEFTKADKFPYLYFNILFLLSISLILLVFKHKR